MKIQIWALGKNHEPYVKPGVEDFSGRITNYYPVQWHIIPTPRHLASWSATDLKKKEAELILNSLKADDWLVVLEMKGKSLSSKELANFLQARADESIRNLVFLIGGAYGLDELVLNKARFQWSLSRLTFPHQLVRLILAEQLYRACSITRNEKYHH